MIYPVVEKFVSINGEGPRAGELAVFIRFRRCNLNCSYCDTRWANTESAPAEMLTAAKLTEWINSTGVTNDKLTGGEPLLQENICGLTDMLINSGHFVEIETNGSISIAELAKREHRPAFTLDYKLPDSGMEAHMLTENYTYLSKCDTVKFVSGSIIDLERAASVISEYSLTEKCNVYLSPVFGKIPPAEMVEFMKSHNLNGVRLQLQLHKFIWSPDKRGV
jgi:7-carboxy-7-deazaguanine synthase